MIAALFIIYRIIVAVLALVVIWDIVRERSLAHVMSLGIICFPLILRALLINEGGTEMKNKSLIPNIAVLLVVALVCVLTGRSISSSRRTTCCTPKIPTSPV